jgi:hypothetical protein
MRDPDLCQRVEHAPAGVKMRRWVLNDSTNSNHHGVVRMGESPLFLHLSWRRSARDPIQFVGVFRLNLPALLKNGYVRPEPKDTYGPEIRLRIVRARDGDFYIQVNQDGLRLLIG